MMLFDSMTAHGYTKLSLNEKFAIDGFFDDSNLKLVIHLLRDESLLPSKDFRNFIADVLEGKAKRSKGRPNYFSMDYEIYMEYHEKNLSFEQIAQEVQKKYPRRLTEDAVRKLFGKIQRAIIEHDEITHAEFTEME